MEKAFLGIGDFLRNYRNCHGDTALSIDLQKAESAAFMDGVVSNLQSGGLKVIPIYDAILCQKTKGGGRNEKSDRDRTEHKGKR